MNPDIVFVELLKIMTTKDKEVLSDSIRTNKLDLIKRTMVKFLKKYKNLLSHVL